MKLLVYNPTMSVTRLAAAAERWADEDYELRADGPVSPRVCYLVDLDKVRPELVTVWTALRMFAERGGRGA